MVDKPMLQVSDITQYFYCPRKVYFLRTLGISPSPRKKMDAGKEEHEREYRRIRERKTIYGFNREDVKKVFHKLPIEAPEHSLHGRVDTVVLLKGGKVIPVDVKYSSFTKVKRNWKKQLVAYAILLEAKFGKEVRSGVLYFPRKRKKVDVEIRQKDKEFIHKDIENILKLIRSEKIPNVQKGKKCNYCEMKKFCV